MKTLLATILIAAVTTPLALGSPVVQERVLIDEAVSALALTCEGQRARCHDLLWADEPEDWGSFQGLIEWIEAREEDGYNILGAHCLDLDDDGEVVTGPGIETVVYDGFAEIIERIGGLEGCCIDADARIAQLAAAFECPEIDLDALDALWAEMVLEVAGCECDERLFQSHESQLPAGWTGARWQRAATLARRSG